MEDGEIDDLADTLESNGELICQVIEHQGLCEDEPGNASTEDTVIQMRNFLEKQKFLVQYVKDLRKARDDLETVHKIFVKDMG